jgi:hypothetical protein
MKVVDQTTGKDLDPTNSQVRAGPRSGGAFGGYAPQDAVLNTVCTRCGGHGHLAIECFVVPGGKKYDLVEDEPEEPPPPPVVCFTACLIAAPPPCPACVLPPPRPHHVHPFLSVPHVGGCNRASCAATLCSTSHRHCSCRATAVVGAPLPRTRGPRECPAWGRLPTARCVVCCRTHSRGKCSFFVLRRAPVTCRACVGCAGSGLAGDAAGMGYRCRAAPRARERLGQRQ